MSIKFKTNYQLKNVKCNFKVNNDYKYLNKDVNEIAE